jgi:hypothetical protein
MSNPQQKGLSSMCTVNINKAAENCQVQPTSNSVVCHQLRCPWYMQAARLFGGLLLQPRLRTGLKAELGAFYPLLLLRPMENDR